MCRRYTTRSPTAGNAQSLRTAAAGGCRAKDPGATVAAPPDAVITRAAFWPEGSAVPFPGGILHFVQNDTHPSPILCKCTFWRCSTDFGRSRGNTRLLGYNPSRALHLFYHQVSRLRAKARSVRTT